MKRTVIVGLLSVALAACQDSRGAGRVAVVRDSADVQIVENRSGAAGALGWRVRGEPSVTIGAAGEGAGGELYQVAEVVRLADGRIVVANAGTNELRFYDREGRHLRTVGRTGDGPGEFRRLLWVGPLRGDSIGAWDAGRGRLTVLDREGNPVRVYSPRQRLGFFPVVHGALPDGSLVLTAGADAGSMVAAGTGVRRDTSTYLVLDPLGAVTDTLGRFPETEQYTMVNRGGFVVHTLPFGRQTVTATHDGRFYVGTGDSYTVRVMEPGRGVRRLIRSDRKPLAVGPEDIEAYRRSMITLGAEGDAHAKRRQQQLLAEVPYPVEMPAFTGLKVDAQGNLWVEEAQRPGSDDEGLWTVFDAEGKLLGSVRTPAGLTVKQIGPDWVLGVFMDDDHVEHVRLHRLTR